MDDPIALADVGSTIGTALADLEPVLDSARNAAEPFIPVPGGAAQFPGYKQWLNTIVASIRDGTDPSGDSDFIQASSAARTELSPYFPPAKDVDLQRAQLDPKYLFFFSNPLLGIFCDQAEDVRDAAADCLSNDYAIPYTPNLLP